MNSDTLRRMPLLVVGLLAFFALSCSSAFAAGKPVISSFFPVAEGGLTSQQLQGVINPNGASTTYKIEYGLTEALGSSTGETSIGSGTTNVTVNPGFSNLQPGTKFYVRLAVKNSYGSVGGSTIPVTTDYWFFGKNDVGVHPDTYVSAGSFKIKFNVSIAGADEIACASKGNGIIGNPGGTGDEYVIQLSNCGIYSVGNKVCSATVSMDDLDGTLTPGVNLIVVDQSKPCWISEHLEIPILQAFTATAPYSLVACPVLLESKVSFGSMKGTVTDSSIWELNGANQGMKFMIQENW